eukprot:m.49265 g.49265  ORF g.49265 m.49265 type:complete len:284 (+) comp7443_c0_seq2:185-1036(+)
MSSETKQQPKEEECLECKDPHFRKFPRTRHVFDVGGTGVSRDDLLLTAKEAQALFYGGRRVHIEEKVDGANLGFSIGDNGAILAQNRSHYVNEQSHSQFKRLDAWISAHMGDLYDILGETPHKCILFGEWLYATHSVEYSALPSYFLAFDIFDVDANKFLSRQAFYRRLANTSIHHVPLITSTTLTGSDDILALLDLKSSFSNSHVEGVYLRVDDIDWDASPHVGSTSSNDVDDEDKPDAEKDEDYLSYRSKVVRPDFLQGMEHHWVSHELKRNKLLEGVYDC